MTQSYNGKPVLLASDLEGVFVPEIWVAVARKTGISQLELTTRDISNYDELMAMRIRILREHGLRLPDIQAVIATMEPLPGAETFMDWIRRNAQLIIISDTFYEFAMPLMEKLGFPTIFCHTLQTDRDGTVTGYTLRLPHSKRRAVRAFRELGFYTVATGDSYNDIAMLSNADVGVLFDPPETIVAEFPNFSVVRSHVALQQYIADQLRRQPTL
jgi:phosphoserine/homoserine phosphotransferase